MIVRLLKVLQSFSNSAPQQSNKGENLSYPMGTNIEWGIPSELQPDLPRVPELEHSMLPRVVSDYVFEQAKSLDNADPEYCAVAVLTAAAALIGGSVVISPKRNNKGWKLKPIIWAINVGSPSKMKTPSLMAGLNLLEYAYKVVIEPENKRVELEFKATERKHKAQISRLEKEAEKLMQEGDEKAANQFFAQIEQLTQPQPQYRKPLLNNATVEALIKRIQTNPLGVLLYRDELLGWIAGLEKKENAEERAFCNEAFNGFGTYEAERIVRGNLIVKNPTLFVLGNIQPDRLKSLVSGRESGQSNDGLFERFQLIVYPDGNRKSYVDELPDQSFTQKMQTLFVKFAQLSSPDRYSNPLGFDFSDDAQDKWDQWATELIAREHKSNDDEQTILGKYGALVAKLALIFHLMIEAEKCENDSGFDPLTKISKYALSLALKWSDFLLQHNRKIRALGSPRTSGFESAETLRTKLCLLPNDFTIRDLQRKGWKGLKSQNEINEALDLLLELGYLKQYTARSASGKTSNRFLVHPNYRSA